MTTLRFPAGTVVDDGGGHVTVTLPGAALSDDTPLVEAGSGDPGVSTEASRSDHVHPEDGSGASLPWFDVTDYGAVHDGSTDDTVAIQDTIDAAEAAGGGVVFFPRGIYALNGALQDTGRSNAQLLLPRLDYVDTEAVTIVLLGESAPPTIPSVIGSTPLATGGSIVKSTLSSGTGAVLGAHGPVGTFGDFSNVHVELRGLTFRTVANPTNSCLDLSRVATARLDDVTVDAGNYDVASISSQSTSTSFGIRLPGNNNGASTALRNVHVIGFYTGVEVGEHTTGDNVNAWGCRIAFTFPFGYHASHFNRIGTYHCGRGLVITDDHYFSIDQMNIEHAASGTWVPVYDIDDASNKGHGHLAWHTVLGGTGVDHVFTVNGATDIHRLEVGDDPFSVAGLDDLSDVTITAAAEDDSLRYVSGGWINDNRRWEPVWLAGDLVWDGDDLVMGWSAY